MHQLTHNTTGDCSMNSAKNTSSQHVVYKNCCFCFCFDIQKNICTSHVFFRKFNGQYLVILWVNWFKNESFWKRFTCKYVALLLPDSSLIVALSWSLVPIGTAWSTGISLARSTVRPLPPSSDLGDASRYRATSYSKVPGDSCTTPETLAAGGLQENKN